MKITALLVVKSTPEGSESDQIVLAHAIDTSSFNFFYRSNVKQLIVFGGKTIAKRTPLGQRLSVSHQEYKVHAYNRDGLCALAFADDHYPIRSAFALLNQIIDKYEENFGESWRTRQENITEPWPYLDEGLQRFQDPAEADRLLRVQRELDETTIILHRTIDSILMRGEKLEDLAEKSEGLYAESQMFNKQTKNANGRCCTLM